MKSVPDNANKDKDYCYVSENFEGRSIERTDYKLYQNLA